MPTLAETTGLLGSTPWSPPPGAGDGPGPGMMMRLKLGYRRVLVAVVDCGIVNYLEFSEGAFGEEALWPRFDSAGAPRGASEAAAEAGARAGAGAGVGARALAVGEEAA